MQERAGTQSHTPPHTSFQALSHSLCHTSLSYFCTLKALFILKRADKIGELTSGERDPDCSTTNLGTDDRVSTPGNEGTLTPILVLLSQDCEYAKPHCLLYKWVPQDWLPTHGRAKVGTSSCVSARKASLQLASHKETYCNKPHQNPSTHTGEESEEDNHLLHFARFIFLSFRVWGTKSLPSWEGTCLISSP